ncbi:MAG: hypothetical protein MOGMAGMI_00533 [Candidatus Omnitrophica bacterium]|nr:hypothetical protein [Candidatus Omnitrophota bacterium]
MSGPRLAVIGAGAAGLSAAIWAARSGLSGESIVLLDSRQRIGAKILISGGTRCNVTNRSVRPSDYSGGPRHFVKHVLEAFPPARTRAFFAEIGVELVLEPTGKYFPTTHKAATVLEALRREVDRLGIRLETGRRILTARRLGEAWVLEDAGGAHLRAERIVLCTGGLSLPETGSDGTGLRIARDLGHTLIATTPALTPLTTQDACWKTLAGLTLEAALSLYLRGRKAHEVSGSMLFTHEGFSGPAPMDLSRHYLRAAGDQAAEVRARFLPGLDESVLIEGLRAGRDHEGLRTVRHFLTERFGLALQLSELLCRRAGLERDERLKDLTTDHRKALVRQILDCPLGVDGTLGYRKAEVTAGGVDLAEVRASTLESRIAAGLHFAGEVLDVDGRIGGFNFQWAWSSGHVAGRACAEALS